MIIKLKELKSGVNRWQVVYKNEELNLTEEDFKCMGPVKVEVQVIKNTQNVELTLNLVGQITLPCSRCLETVEKEIKDKATYFIKLEKEEFKEVLEEEDITTIYLKEGELDIVPLVRESLILSLPMKILCQEDCKGLCSICGNNLNLSDCGHRIEDTSKELKKLKELF